MTRLNDEQLALVRSISAECKTPADVTAMLKSLFAGTLEQMLQAEMDMHLGYDKHSPTGDLSGNSRNGYGAKTIKSEWGEAEIAVPRDRAGTFSPVVIFWHYPQQKPYCSEKCANYQKIGRRPSDTHR